MLRRHSLVFYLAIAFLVLSATIYFIHYIIFHDIHHIFIYMVGDLAFLPLEVLIVVLIIERVLARREKQAKLQKLNMVVGAFFSEVGNHLLINLLQHFDNQSDICKHMNIKDNWTRNDFRQAAKYAYSLHIELDCHKVNLEELKAYLSQKRSFLITLLENPILLEHDRFTDLLWAVTHLDEELMARPLVNDLPDKDLEHIAGDIQRFYDHLASEWLDYVEHLKANYPFLFSLILRTHPFQDYPQPIFS
ncbi:hypothetical protein ACFLTP_02250 [Chloroflexota bacterium]